VPRDYKARANTPRRAKKRAIPCWVCFIGGLLVGLFMSGLAWLKLLPPGDQPTAAIISRPPVIEEQREEAAPAATQPKPSFEFYTILPEMEVVVPEPDPEPPVKRATKPGKKPTTAPKTAAADRFMLQMGSFRKFADADRLKASLALVGIQAEIQKVRIGAGDTFHRVRAGPYSRSKANTLRARLQQNSINSLIIKLK